MSAVRKVVGSAFTIVALALLVEMTPFNVLFKFHV